MNSGGIRIGKVTLRLRGVKPAQAEERAGSIAREIARRLAAPGALPAGQSEIPSLSLRLPPGGRSRE